MHRDDFEQAHRYLAESMSEVHVSQFALTVSSLDIELQLQDAEEQGDYAAAQVYIEALKMMEEKHEQ